MTKGTNTVVVNKKKNPRLESSNYYGNTPWEVGNLLKVDSKLTANDFYTLKSVMSWIAK
jgi:hypothetical protein